MQYSVADLFCTHRIKETGGSRHNTGREQSLGGSETLFKDPQYEALIKRIGATPEARSLKTYKGDMFWMEKDGNFGFLRFSPGDGPRFPEVKFFLDGGLYVGKFENYWADVFRFSKFKFPASKLTLPYILYATKPEFYPKRQHGYYWAFEERNPYDIFGLFAKHKTVDDLFDDVYGCFRDMLRTVQSTLTDREVCDKQIDMIEQGYDIGFMALLGLVVLLKLNGWHEEAKIYFDKLTKEYGEGVAYRTQLPHLKKIGY